MALAIGRTPVRVHPLALMVPLALAMLEPPEEALALIAGLIVHEGAHLLAARALGVRVSLLRLMPFGGAIQMDNPYALPPARLLAVAMAGPAGSLLLVLSAAALAHWRVLAPPAAAALLRVNLALLAFNLLPALPMDGGRALYALLVPRLGRARAANVGILLGRAVAAALLVAAIRGALRCGPFNLSFAMAAVFILASAADEREALGDARARAVLNGLRPVLRPVPARLFAVGGDCSVRAALRAARPDALTLYAVYDGSRLSSITDDRRLLEAALMRDMDIPVARAAGERLCRE